MASHLNVQKHRQNTFSFVFAQCQGAMELGSSCGQQQSGMGQSEPHPLHISVGTGVEIGHQAMVWFEIKQAHDESVSGSRNVVGLSEQPPGVGRAGNGSSCSHSLETVSIGKLLS